MGLAPLSPEARSDLDTATTLTLVALVLEVAFLVLAGAFSFFVLFAAAFLLDPSVVLPFPVHVPAFMASLVVLGLGIAVLFVVLTYLLIYRPLREGRVEEALTPALVLGLVTLIVGGTIPGVLLVLAYVKAKDAHTKARAARQRRPEPEPAEPEPET